MEFISGKISKFIKVNLKTILEKDTVNFILLSTGHRNWFIKGAGKREKNIKKER